MIKPHFPLLQEVYEMDYNGREDAALDAIMNHIDDSLLLGKFGHVDRLLDAVDASRYSTTVVLAFLTASLAARDKLEAYAGLFARTKAELDRRDPKRTEKLLAGLEPSVDPLRTTCQSAVAAFGTEYQLRKTQEECCELGAAINQYLDGKISAEELASEAADNEITAPYVRLAIGDALVDEAKTRKLERLRGIVRAKMESDNV